MPSTEIARRVAQARDQAGVAQTIDVDRYRNLLAMFGEAVARFAERPAFTSLGRTLTFAELDRYSAGFAAWLQSQPDLKPGDRIALQLPNIVQYPVALFGALRAGLVVVNTNPLYSAAEAEHQFNDAGVKALVVLANVAHVAASILPRTGVKVVIVTEVADLHPPLRRAVINFAARRIKKMVPPFDIPGAVRYTDVIRQGDPGQLRQADPEPNELAVLQYTGGTTGVAKGAMLSHRNLMANTLQGEEMFATYGIRPGQETFIAPLPLYHIYSFILSMIMLTSGNHSVLIPNPRDLNAMVKDMKKWPFTGLSGLNTLFVALCNHEGFRALDFSHLKVTISGGMALTSGAARRWQECTGQPVFEGYGLTEASPVVSVNPGNNNQLGTIGIALSSTEVRLIDDDGNDVPINEPGELCVRGPQVMLGYWNRDDETRKVLDAEGWLKTGDIAVVREDGYLKIVDRKKDLITVSGFKVFPGEVEDVISRHPGIVECAVIGVPDEHSGEVVKVFVVARDPSLTEAAVREFARQELTGYKVPKMVEFRSELPKSNVGKVLRRELREEEARKSAAGQGSA
ncbi:MAG: AMP-binding protein [Spongiibacteraceae bacterium]|nr:AMP-binding protein [Spongiibacteraceae bacterium]